MSYNKYYTTFAEKTHKNWRYMTFELKRYPGIRLVAAIARLSEFVNSDSSVFGIGNVGDAPIGVDSYLRIIYEDLCTLKICPDIQGEINGQIEYLFSNYQRMTPLVENDKQIMASIIREWEIRIYKTITTEFYLRKKEEEPIIFIGHGHNKEWKDLKDHLIDKHHFKVEAYETDQRAGNSINDNVTRMIEKSSIAFLVFTGELTDNDGKLHAKENVIHEFGLCQQRLGLKKSIILLEEGIEEPSNISGIAQIRFPKDSICEIFGDIIAVIRREFLI